MTRPAPHPGRRRTALPLAAACLAAALPLAAAAHAQDRQEQAEGQDQQADSQLGYSRNLSQPLDGRPPIADTIDTGPPKAGSVATSTVGAVGQRQEHGQAVANITPMARLNTRVANRIESRIRNRVDRFYDPEANATSPFKVAAERAQISASQSR